MSEIGVCVVGSGRAGLIHGRNFSSGRVPGARLVSVVDPHADACRHACEELGVEASFHDFRDAIKDPAVDAVVVATPTKHHAEVAVAAADAGKHILCEKPMAMSAEECDQMIAAAERTQVVLQIGFMRRFDESFVAARQRVSEEEIGRVVLVKSLTHGPTTPKPWMYDIQQSNGPLAEVNSHDIDTLRWFTDSEFEEVYAIGGNYRSSPARQRFPDFYDNVVLTARFRNGMQGAIFGAQGVQYGYDARCEILGEKGLITVGSLAAKAIASHTSGGTNRPIVRSWMDLFLDAYRAEDADFVRCIRENDTPRADGYDGKAAVCVVIAGNRSIADRCPIQLTEDGRVK